MQFKTINENEELKSILESTQEEHKSIDFNVIFKVTPFTVKLMEHIANYYKEQGIQYVYIITNNVQRVNTFKKMNMPYLKVVYVNTFRQVKQVASKNIYDNSLLIIDNFEKLCKPTTQTFREINHFSSHFKHILCISQDSPSYFTTNHVIMSMILSKFIRIRTQFIKRYYRNYDTLIKEQETYQAQPWRPIIKHDKLINQMVARPYNINNDYVSPEHANELIDFMKHHIHFEITDAL